MKNENNEQKKKRERSIAYPSFPLGDAIESSGKLRKALGKGPYSRNEAAIALGYKGVSGISATKISAMVHFGLLNRNGNTYSQSELAERINHPITDEDKNNAISEAIQVPRLYKDLLAQFSGQALPTQLGNILIRKGISAKISDSVAEIFRSSLEFSGFLENGVVLLVPNLTSDASKGEEKTNTGVVLMSPGVNSKQIYTLNDSGNGWSLTIKSGRPLTSDIKKKIVDITEFLENGDISGNTEKEKKSQI